MQEKSLNVEIRTEKGKNANRRLRESGYIPAVLYSHGESESIKIDKKDFFSLFHGHISESVIFDLNYKENADLKQMAFVKDYHVDPVSGEVLHLDFFKVTLGEKINTNVPIEITGTPVGIKMGGLLEVSEREIEIECLPKNLPSKIVVDVSKLDVGDSIHVKDLDLSDEVTIMNSGDTVIAAVHLAKVSKAEEEEEAAEEVVEEEGGGEVKESAE
jgi:large subunit ribosomal protein L25